MATGVFSPGSAVGSLGRAWSRLRDPAIRGLMISFSTLWVPQAGQVTSFCLACLS